MQVSRIAAPLPTGKGIFIFRRVVALVMALSALGWGSAMATTPAQSATKGVGWLLEQQAANGSLGSDVGRTAEFVLAMKAAGQTPSPSAVEFLKSNAAAAITAGPGTIGKVLLAAKAAGQDPRVFGGKNLVAALTDAAVAGSYDTGLPGQAFAMLGLAAAGVPQDATTALQILKGQAPDGGWGFSGAPVDPYLSDTNDTALAVQALLVAEPIPGVTDVAIARALQFLALNQDDEGGFAYQRVGAFCSPVCTADVNSTAYVIEALVAAGEDIGSAAWTKGSTPVGWLVAHQNADGSFFSDWDKVMATVQAVPAVVGKPLACVADSTWC